MSSRSVGWHVVVTLAGQWAKYLVQIVALVVFSRMLNPTDFGIVAMVTAVSGIAYALGDFGLSLAALQAKNLTDGQRSNVFWMTAGIGVLIGGTLAACGPLLAVIYHNHRVVPVAVVLSVVFVANGFAGHFRTELNRAHRFEWIASADVSGQVGGFVIGLVIVLVGGGLWGLVIQQVSAAIITLCVLAATAGWWPGMPRRGERMWGLVRFGGFSLLGSVAQYISINADQMLVGRVWGAGVLGFYNRAFQVARVPAQQIGAPLTRVVLPHLVVRLDDRPRFIQGIRRAQGLLGAALILMLSYLIAVAPSAMRIALGPGWGPSIPLVRMLCLAGIFEASTRVFFWALLAHGRPGTIAGIELGARAVMVALMAVAASHGAIWVATAAAAGQFLLLISNSAVTAPKAGVPALPLLGIAAAVQACILPATLVTMYADRWTHGWPVVLAWLALSGLWLALSAPSLLVPAVRHHVVDSVRYIRTMAARRR